MALDILIIFFSFIYGNLLIVNSNFLIWNIVSIFQLILILELLTWCTKNFFVCHVLKSSFKTVGPLFFNPLKNTNFSFGFGVFSRKNKDFSKRKNQGVFCKKHSLGALFLNTFFVFKFLRKFKNTNTNFSLLQGFFYSKCNNTMFCSPALSLIKRGLLLGIFIEAFKVGS